MEGNWIGEGGAREVMLMLQQRKEAGLPAVKMRVSPRICPEIFTEIVELNAMSGTKKKKGKAKKKVHRLLLKFSCLSPIHFYATPIALTVEEMK